ncbi:MAG TPA: hypothetical protein VHF51_07180 [Solirubrobacteraceae bacterium]|nr:hypothetical protein [Solirubrobacteraceae bacterium]
MRENPSVYQRRRLTALGVVAAVAALAGAAMGAGSDKPEPAGGGDATERAAAAQAPPRPPELPLGGRTIFPHYRVVAFYGAPQSDELGALGIGSPDAAARRLRRQARPYARKTRPVMLAFELIATVANAHPGADGMYRTRQSAAVVRRYLRAARRAKALLLLDIQPGHADFMDEVRHLDRWLREPDVGIALDPEWHTPGAQPGTTIGSVNASKVNQVARHVAAIVRERNLPEKLFVVHQFTADMIKGKQHVIRPPGLAVTMNVDGFGNRANKVSKYREFTHDGTPFHHGYKLFYKEDTGLMRPRSVLALRPPPDLVVYE